MRPGELGREVTSPSAADAGAGTDADVDVGAVAVAVGAGVGAVAVGAVGAGAGAGAQQRHFWVNGEELALSYGCRGHESGVAHAGERAHVSAARARKPRLAGWGQHAGAAAAALRNTSDGLQGSAGGAGRRQRLWLWHAGRVGRGASGAASAARCRCYPHHRWYCRCCWCMERGEYQESS